ncbi:MAG: hypothetical protein HYZ29_21760 [Myxococcales bacterium]|nr:hypothetical protein [Myxococcales bacterium]
MDIPLRCTCGAVKGVAREVSPRRGTRVVCMCIDCQTYAQFLGRADEILDAHGGTDIFQLAPGQLEIQQGADRLRCVRLSAKGAMRWYADCCKTPVGNTAPSPRIPFVGVPHLFMDHGASPDGRERDLGPVRFRVQAEDGHGEVPPGSHPRFPPRLLARTLFFLLRTRLTGLARPTPFWDDRGQPSVTPLVLSKAERAELRQRCER